METTNPAGRLHEILSEAKKLSGTPVEVWGKMFNLRIDSEHAKRATEAQLETEIEVISSVLQLKKLIEDCEESLRNIEGLSEKYFRPFDRIRPIIRQSLSYMTSDLKGVLGTLTEGDMTV